MTTEPSLGDIQPQPQAESRSVKPLTPRAYLSYLIRLWMDDRGVWRASAEDPQQSDLRTFTSFETLIRFLREAMGGAATGPGPQDE
jgi:hypothetical protein